MTPIELNDLEESASGKAVAAITSGAPVFENFVDFTTSLVTNVIEVIVGSTIDQLEAYADLVANVSGTVAEYQARTFPNLEAEGGDAIKYINDVIGPTYGATTPWVALDNPGGVIASTTIDLDPAKLSEFLAQFGGILVSDKPIGDIAVIPDPAAPAISSENLYAFTVAKFKKQTQTGYDQLVTILKLGMQKVVITNGRIATSLVFKSSGRDSDSAQSTEKKSSDLVVGANIGGTLSKRLMKKATTGKLAISGKYSQSQLSVLTEQKSATNSVDITITGGVELNFRTESFPSFDPTPP